MIRTLRLALAGLFAAAIAIAGVPRSADAADPYPTRPVKIYVGFVPGGSVDLMARFYGKHFAEALGQSFIVENRPGAAGNIAAELVAKSKPDGYTLLLTSVVHSINASLYHSLRYDAAKDFAGISPVGLAPNGIFVAPSFPIQTLGELVAYAKAHPGELFYASSGSGTLMHMGMELFNEAAGIKLVHVPYNGTGLSVNAVMSEQVPILSSGYGSAEPYAASGKLKTLAISTAERSPLAPDVPTAAEAAGLPGYEAVGWMGLLAPAGTPVEIVTRLNAEILRVQKLPDVPEWLAKQGITPYYLSPDGFNGLVKADVEKWRKVVNETGVKAD